MILHFLGCTYEEIIKQLNVPKKAIKWRPLDEYDPRRGFVEYPDHGIELVFTESGNTEKLHTIFLTHSEKQKKPHPELFFNNIFFNDSLETVVSKIDKYYDNGGNTNHPIFGKIHPWFKFKVSPNKIIHCEFENNLLIKITYLLSE